MRVVFVLSLLFLVACSNSGSTPDASVVTFRLVGTPAPASVSDVIFCLTRMDVKVDADEVGLPATAFSLGLEQTRIDPSGTPIGSILLPDGTYERVELRLDDRCLNISLSSVLQFRNGNSSQPFRPTDELIILKFIGVIDVRGSATVTLDASALFAAMEGITDSAQVKPAFEAIVGEF